MSDQLDIKKLRDDVLIAALRKLSRGWQNTEEPLRVCGCGRELRSNTAFCRRCLQRELDRRINNMGTGE